MLSTYCLAKKIKQVESSVKNNVTNVTISVAASAQALENAGFASGARQLKGVSAILPQGVETLERILANEKKPRKVAMTLGQTMML